MKRRRWTDTENRYLQEHYPDGVTADIAKHLGRTAPAVVNQVRKLGLKKSDEYFKVCSQRYQKGSVPLSKGTKMSDSQYKKCKGTMFKKEHRAANMLPIGTIRTRHNLKKGTHYLYIKIAELPGVWVELHRYNWEKENGPIPKGFHVGFKDGNTINCEPGNLELITRKEIMRRNTIHNMYPEELKKTIHALGAFKRKIKTYERRNQTAK